MHHTQAIEVDKLGANIIIDEDSSLHHTHALEIVKIATSKGGKVTIKKSYHHTQLNDMAKVGGNNVTIKI